MPKWQRVAFVRVSDKCKQNAFVEFEEIDEVPIAKSENRKT
jgi:hypothetical protein